jgi:phospholipid/cholesterol/gamma-HCH transport system substrate-binding protein
MSAYRKNVMVGATVLVSLVALAWMLLKFGGGPAALFTPAELPVQFIAGRADGLGQGSAVLFRGVEVGRIIKIYRSPDNTQILIDAMIDRDPPLPGNLTGFIRAQSLLGAGTSISLERVDPETGRPTTEPLTGGPVATLVDHQRIQAKYIGLDVLPPEFGDLARELRTTSQQLRASHIIEHADEAVQQSRDLVANLRKITEDPKIRGDVQSTIDNLKAATVKANRIADNIEKFSGQLQTISSDAQSTIHTANQSILKTQGHIDDISRQLADRLTQVAQILDSFQSVALKVDAGKGTAGALINDPRLYDSLVDTSKELNSTLADLKRLIDQWEQEGIYFKLNK